MGPDPKLAQGGERRGQHERIENDLLFDYGAEKSVREMAAGKEWRVYFQKLDKEMHHKILQQQLLDMLVDFLDEHGVDTSEIKERTTHILNNGVIVSGGSINA
jgi:predicted Ser/Thr protein kinase